MCTTMNLRHEFQVVVLAAGKGSRMPELTTHKPKCLLPIGGKPMVWYPLHKLQQSGFTDVILIVCDNDKNDIHSALDKTELSIKIEYITIQSTDECGTAESLCSIADKIKLDLIVVSCDLVTNMDFAEVLHVFRKHEASLASLYFPPNIHIFNNTQYPTEVPGPKNKYKPERDLIGVDTQTNRLVFAASTSDFENDVSIPINMFRKHPNVKMYSNLMDSHFYVMKNWLLKYLHEKAKYSTLKGEFLPHVLKQQFKRKSDLEQMKIKSNISEIKDVKTGDVFDFQKETSLERKIREANGYNDHIGDLKGAYHDDLMRCYAIITDPSVIGVRVNTLQAYWTLNKKIASAWDQLFDDKLPLVQVDPTKATIKSTQVDNCFIWDGVSINEKTSFKNSILASNTQVSSFSRIIDSVVMNNVQIHERVVVENCIICDDVVINNNSKLQGCIIGAKQNLPAESEHSKEVLTDTEIF